jgi:hypothetical protein
MESKFPMSNSLPESATLFAVVPSLNTLSALPGVEMCRDAAEAARKASERGSSAIPIVVLAAPIERLRLSAVTVGGAVRSYSVDPVEAEADAQCFNRLNKGSDQADVITVDAWIEGRAASL